MKAAQSEGSLTLPGTSDSWNLELRVLFSVKYGIRIVSSPVATDASELADSSLDIYDLGVDTASAHTSELAPYLVFYWKEVPASLKNPRAYWIMSCGGYVDLAYDANRVPPATSLSDLAKRGYSVRIPVGLAGSDEMIADAAALSLASGAPAGDAADGLDLLHTLKTLETTPPAFIGWNFDAPPEYAPFPLTRTVVAYTAIAINRAAPHPAAARLWDEFVFSDAGQNICVQHDASPARLEAMRSDGVLDVQDAAALQPTPPGAVMLTPAQMSAARAYVDAHWAAALGQ